VIDQFIASGETTWERVCGLTLLLPHGFEGQGPEHSSARLERFLQLCAEDNMQVMTPTTPAQIFHALRRQAIRPIRKPMIIMSPKSLLRHKLATSTLSELANGTFQTVNGQVEILPMMYLALSYDHRLIDGKEAVGFLVTIKELLEEPAKLILDL
jgi:2-oxoglutarate dehydrogenase E1 component